MYVGSQNQLKAYDAYLIEHGYTIEQLIDYASDALLKHISSYQHIGILVGPGNNGADGLSLGLKLDEAGKDVCIYYIGDYSRFSQGNRYYFNQCLDQLRMINLDETFIDEKELNRHDVIVDAFFGFGLNSAPRGLYKSVIDLINLSYRGDVIAVDCPTGLNCNTGIPYSTVLFAQKTIALSALKEGFLNPESQVFTGDVVVEELAIDNPFMEAGLYALFDKQDAQSMIKQRRYDGYKNMYGIDLLICGSHQYRGAPILSAKGALYSGAGIVKVMSDEKVIDLLPLSLPECIGISRYKPITKEELQGYDAILIGCGLSLEKESYLLTSDVLVNANSPLVIDADALTILSTNMSLLKDISVPVILTPHIGEFKRMWPYEEGADLMEEATAFAKAYDVILVLKGPHTIITDGTEHYRIASGNKAMAVGGMGDTLAGMITSFLGQGYAPLSAALLGTYIHGFTGDILARKRYTVMPELLAEQIPCAMYILSQKIEE